MQYLTNEDAVMLTGLAKSLTGLLMSKGVLQNCDRDDFRQELILAVVQQLARGKFTPMTGTLKTFAYRVMELHALELVRKLRSHYNSVIRDAVSLSLIFENDDGADILHGCDLEHFIDSEIMPPSNIFHEGSTFWQVRTFVKKLKSKEQKICIALMDGKDFETIVSEFGLSRSALRWKIKKIKAAMKAFGLNVQSLNFRG